MNLTKIYEKINESNIEVMNWKMKNTKARIVNDCYSCIFIDYSQINSYVEEKEILAEEYGHYKYEAYYTLLDDQNFIDKQEYKAQKWKALNLCPVKSILSCIKERIDKLLGYCRKIANCPRNSPICDKLLCRKWTIKDRCRRWHLIFKLYIQTFIL